MTRASMTRAPSLALALLAALAPAGAGAQRAHAVVDVGAGRLSSPDLERAPLYGDAAAMVAWDRVSVAGRVSSAPTSRLPGGAYGTLSLAGAQPIGGGFVAAFGASAGTGRRASWIEDARRDVEVAPTLARGRWSLSARFAASRVYDWDERTSRSRELFLRRDFARGWVVLSAGLSSFADTATVVRDTVYTVAGFRFRGTVERLGTTSRDWDRTGLEVGGSVRDVRWVARGGLPLRRAADAPYAPWASLTTTWPIGPRAAVVLSAGRHPGLPEHRIAASSFAMAGVRLTSLARAGGRGAVPAVPALRDDARAGARLQVLARADGRRLLLITGLRATRVDFNGDPTNWEPVTLERVGPDTWQAALPMAAGAHRVVVSVDGGPWRPPPGLPITSDGFGEDVGVLLVPEA